MKRVIILCILFWLLQVESVWGDGCMILPVVYSGREKVSSDAQKALLVWRQGEEILHLQSSYSGPTSDFAWVIPLPSIPEVERANWEVFKELEKATRPHLEVLAGMRYKSYGCGCSAGPMGSEMRSIETGVRELQSLDIGDLHVDVVSAQEAGGFLRWLHEHNYTIPENAEPVLQNYIIKEFYFVVAKIRKISVYDEFVTPTMSGGLTPLALRFKTDKPFFPLEISSISSAAENEILILTVAEHRLEPIGIGFTELSQGDIENTIANEVREKGSNWTTLALDFGPAIRQAQERLLQGGLVLECVLPLVKTDGDIEGTVYPRKLGDLGKTINVTRYHTYLKPNQMQDIYFTTAETDAPVPGKFYIDSYHTPSDEIALHQASVRIIGLSMILTMLSQRKKRQRTKLPLIALMIMLLGMILL